MENSGKILLPEDTKPEWFIVQGDRWLGPFTVAEIHAKIESREVGWAHFAWKQGESRFQRICEIKEIQAAVPATPSADLLKRAPTVEKSKRKPVPPPPGAEIKEWFLYYNDSQFGPFAKDEIVRFLQVGKVHARVHAWKDGLETWERLKDIPEFHRAVEDAKNGHVPPPPKGKIREQREAPRRPLVARIYLVKDLAVTVAVCRDISVGGMQILTDRIPGDAGDRIKLNVSPAGGELGGEIKPFIAEGVIVRVLEDNRGFSFRFEHLPNDAKAAIEKYIASTD